MLITNLKLQKLLYFIQAAFLALTESHLACFNEEIEAWNFGPVVPEVYQAFKRFGSSNIPYVDSYVCYKGDIWSSEVKKYSNDIIDYEDQKIIQSVVNMFSDYSATQLVEITHNQSPWKNTYEQNQNNIITKATIRSYFERR